MVSKKKIVNRSSSIGQVYTPEFVAKFMVINCWRFIEALEDKNLQFKYYNEMKVLEPSVGKGIFIKQLLQYDLKNICAYELDNSLKSELLKKYPNVNIKFENFLGSDIDEKYDLIIGNPPYLGQNYNANIFQEYVRNFPVCTKFFVGNMDIFYFFIHLGILKLKAGGLLSFITTNYWITKSQKTGIKLLKPHILEECFLLQYIDLSELTLFKNATGQHNCIFVLQKKTNKEKSQNIDKPIDIIQVRKGNLPIYNEELNELVFSHLINNKESNYLYKYKSALTNRDLKKEHSWNLLFPQEIKDIVDKIEQFCYSNGRISYLIDYFIMRNGLIFIKDDLFILDKDRELMIHGKEFFINIKGNFIKLSDSEKNQLKKVYKSKSIKQFCYNKEDFVGYSIYLNKNEFISENRKFRNKLYEKKYPALTNYLKQFENDLKAILINAQENPDDLYFPRRGSFIKRKEGKKAILVDLEPFYDSKKKIFIRYISKDNIFGYSNALYYATSDTYFLWPKIRENEIDYPFLVAYFNSSLCNFIFKAKNISIKRSKTKLEHELPIPNLNLLRSERKVMICSIIRFLASFLMDRSQILDFDFEFYKLECFNYLGLSIYIDGVKSILKNQDRKSAKKLINELFFDLFEINSKEIDGLIKKYY